MVARATVDIACLMRAFLSCLGEGVYVGAVSGGRLSRIHYPLPWGRTVVLRVAANVEGAGVAYGAVSFGGGANKAPSTFLRWHIPSWAIGGLGGLLRHKYTTEFLHIAKTQS
jgi:hypothetical protein